jgi:hypothetical protein
VLQPPSRLGGRHTFPPDVVLDGPAPPWRSRGRCASSRDRVTILTALAVAPGVLRGLPFPRRPPHASSLCRNDLRWLGGVRAERSTSKAPAVLNLALWPADRKSGSRRQANNSPRPLLPGCCCARHAVARSLVSITHRRQVSTNDGEFPAHALTHSAVEHTVRRL